MLSNTGGGVHPFKACVDNITSYMFIPNCCSYTKDNGIKPAPKAGTYVSNTVGRIPAAKLVSQTGTYAARTEDQFAYGQLCFHQ
ncbi:hypothetical protein D3C80_1311730 [compost metagenome]